MASEIEAQTVRWVAELVGYPETCGGLLVSGGNMANFVCFLAGRRAMLGEEVRAPGLAAAGAPLRVYASAGTHTWIQKACDLFGLGTDAIRWISDRRRAAPAAGRAPRRGSPRTWRRGDRPMLVVGTAGSVSTGAVDPIRELADDLPRARTLAPRGRRLRRAGRRAARRAGRSPCARPGRLARGGPAQVALRAARGRAACWCASRGT